MLGCDIIEIDRVERVYNKHGDKFINRVLTEKEQSRFEEKNRSIQFLAGRFACKEAVSKAVGTGVRGDLAFKDIEILNNEKGKPEVYIKGKKSKLEVSISHSRDYAMAVAMTIIMENRNGDSPINYL